MKQEEKNEILAGMEDLRLVGPLESLQILQDELKKLDEDNEKEWYETEAEYNRNCRELYEDRNGMIAKIPHFWFNVLLNLPEVSERLTDNDKKILKYLETIHVEYPNEAGFKITLGFQENPYFENKKLVLPYLDDTITVSKIQWRQGVPNSNKQFRFFDDSLWEELNDSKDILAVTGRIATDLWKNPLKYFSKVKGDVGHEGKKEVVLTSLEEIFPGESLESVQSLQNKLIELEEAYERKLNENEDNYKRTRSKLYEERNKVIESIPQFWFKVCLGHPEVSKSLTDMDKEILKYLETVHVESPNECGTIITLGFKQNPFFENESLVLPYFDDIIAASKIVWKSVVSNSTFITLFDDSLWEKLDDSEVVELEEFIMNALEIITTDLWENPLEYFSKMISHVGDEGKKGRDDAFNKP